MSKIDIYITVISSVVVSADLIFVLLVAFPSDFRPAMNQAEVSKLMSQLRIAVKPHVKKLRNPDGPEGRLKKLRKTVNALIKHERIELNYPRADEARQYAERVSYKANEFNLKCGIRNQHGMSDRN